MERKFTLKKPVESVPLKLTYKQGDFDTYLASIRKELLDKVIKDMAVPLHMLDIRFVTSEKDGKFILTAHVKVKDKS